MTLHESSKFTIEHALHVARIQFEPRPNSRALGPAGSVITIGLTRGNKIDLFRGLGFGDFKGLTRFRQSLLFSYSITKKKIRGSSTLKVTFDCSLL